MPSALLLLKFSQKNNPQAMKPAGRKSDTLMTISGNKKSPGFSAGDVLIDDLFASVYNALYLSVTHIEFFCQRFIAYAVYQPPIHDRSVAF
jgi:hypothetical protein